MRTREQEIIHWYAEGCPRPAMVISDKETVAVNALNHLGTIVGPIHLDHCESVYSLLQRVYQDGFDACYADYKDEITGKAFRQGFDAYAINQPQ